jgi:TolA-binding protein
MKLNSSIQMVSLCFVLVFLSSCLKTRSEVGENEQSQVYSKKNAANQSASESQLNQKQAALAPIDERDDMIRTLNGRVENLENQITSLNKEKSSSTNQDSQKIQLLQEALTKMEAQLQKLEAEQIQKKATSDAIAASQGKLEERAVKSTRRESALRTKESEKNVNTYEVAQGFFASHDWKKAILNYQKYADDFPKGKEVADAKYKIGVCFQELGMKEESMAFFEEVIANYGKSDAGKKAKIRLAKIKK